jgi:hypothetical protein
MSIGHTAFGAHLVAYAHEYVATRDWCLMYHVKPIASLEVFRQKNDVAPLPAAPTLGDDDGSYTVAVRKRLQMYSNNYEYINIPLCVVEDADYKQQGTWLIVDPFLTSWLRAQRRKTTHKKALLTLEKLSFVADGGTYNATVKFPFKVYQWSLLVLRTLSFLCAACGRISDTPLLACERCKSARYCDKKCQKKHHTLHQGLCSQQSKTGVMVANKHDFKLAVRDIIARFQLDVPLGHCIAEKYVAEDDDAVDAAIREVVLMRL